jgi:urease accessory protein
MTQTAASQSTKAMQPGRAGLSVEIVAGQSAAVDVWCCNPLKVLTPRFRGPSVWAYTSSFGGGMVAGDETSLHLQVGSAARCFLTTQASTKIYRNPAGRPCGHHLSAYLGKDSLLVAAPDPVQSFAGSSYCQTQEFHLQTGAGLVLLDWFCSGRAARGERWNFNRLQSRNEITIDGTRSFFDSLALDHAHGPLTDKHRLGRFNCVALLALIGEPLRAEAELLLERTKTAPVEDRASLILSASKIRHGSLLRVAGENFEDVAHFIYQLLGFVGGLLRDDPWVRKLHSAAGPNLTHAPFTARN